MQPFLYCVRHGQTDANKENRLLGRLDPELNETGKAHAAHVATWLSDKNIARIFSSPLQRSAMTAEAIAQTTGAKITIDPLLLELDYGDIDGMRIADAKAAGIYQIRDADRMNYRPKGGETFYELLARVKKFFEREKLLEATQPTVLVSHQGVTRMIAGYLGLVPQEKAPYMSFEHETILAVSRADNQIETKIIDISSHD